MRKGSSARLALLLLLLLRSSAAAQDGTPHLTPQETLERRLELAVSRNKDRQQRLAVMLQEAGCSGERLVLQKVRRSGLPNVVCTLPGESDARIVIGAHYDMTGQGQGVADNWTGAVLLAGLAETLLAGPRRHTFVLVGFTDEERGLIGSKGFVAGLSPAQKANIRAMVNLDTLGLDSSKVWLSRADKMLVEHLAMAAAQTGLPIQAVNMEQVGSTDSESFRKSGIPAITIHSITQETWSILHTSRDVRSAVRLDHYHDTYRLIAAYVARLDQELGAAERKVAAEKAE